MKLRYYLRGLGIGIIVIAIIMSFTRQPEKLSDAQIKMRALELGMVEESVLADLQNKKEESHIPAFEDIVNVEEENTEESDTMAEESENAEESDSEAEEGNIASGESNSEVEEGNSASEESNSEAEEGNSVSGESNSETEGTNAAENSNTAAQEQNSAEQGNIVTEEQNNIEENNSDSVANADSNIGSVIVSPEEVVEQYIVILVESGNGSEIISRRLYEAGLVNSAVEYNRFLVRNGYDRKLKVGNHEIPVGATEEEMAKILCGMQ